MRLELHRNIDGTGFAICVCSEQAKKQIVIPLSQDLSNRIEFLLAMEGLGGSMLPVLEAK